jgi:type 1 fimbriae regulatory protein FimE
MSILSNSRKYLTPHEVETVCNIAKRQKHHGFRNYTMILLAFRHGLRVSELINLEWNTVDLATGTIAVNRLKHGTPSVHPLTGNELRALRRLRRDNPESRYVFVSQKGGPMNRQNFNYLLADLGKEAGFEFPLHPHMLRHACGYKLANEGRDTRSLQHYLGHKNIQSTVVYTNLDSNRFNGWFRD